MMTITVEVWKSFDLTVSEKKADTMCTSARDGPPEKLEVCAAGQDYAQIHEFVSFEDSIIEMPNFLDAGG